MKKFEELKPYKTQSLEENEEYKNLIAKTAKEKAELKNSKPTEGKETANFSSLSGSTDLLGMSPEQWKLLFTNTETLSDNIKKIGMAIQGLWRTLVALCCPELNLANYVPDSLGVG